MSLSILSLILLVVILLGILLMTKNKKPFVPNLRNYFFLFYCAVLLLAALAVYALPDQDFIQRAKNNPDQAISEARQTEANLFEIAKQGNLDHTKGIYLNLSQDFIVGEDRLNLKLANGMESEVWIERKDSNDGKIEVRSYVTPHLVEHVDFSAKIRPPVISLEGNKLQIQPPARYTLDLKTFKDNFISAQFRGSSPAESFGNTTVFGRQIIYLRIPAGMKVSSNQPYIIYLD